MAPPLKIGGQERPIRFDFESIMLAEDTLEYPIRPLLTRHRALTGSQIVVLAWAAWRAETRTLTVEQVRGWIKAWIAEGGSLLVIENAIVNALLESAVLIPAVATDDERPTPGAAIASPAPASIATN